MFHRGVQTLLIIALAWYVIIVIGASSVFLPVAIASFAAATGLTANLAFAFARTLETEQREFVKFVNKLGSLALVQTMRITLAALCSVFVLPLLDLVKQDGLTHLTQGVNLVVSVGGLASAYLMTRFLYTATGRLVNTVTALLEMAGNYDDPRHVYSPELLALNETLPIVSRLPARPAPQPEIRTLHEAVEVDEL